MKSLTLANGNGQMSRRWFSSKNQRDSYTYDKHVAEKKRHSPEEENMTAAATTGAPLPSDESSDRRAPETLAD